ncbi:MAG: hypothetical protein ACQET7_11395 [Thermodesulfobacteriota bacterium]
MSINDDPRPLQQGPWTGISLSLLTCPLFGKYGTVLDTARDRSRDFRIPFPDGTMNWRSSPF